MFLSIKPQPLPLRFCPFLLQHRTPHRPPPRSLTAAAGRSRLCKVTAPLYTLLRGRPCSTTSLLRGRLGEEGLEGVAAIGQAELAPRQVGRLGVGLCVWW